MQETGQASIGCTYCTLIAQSSFAMTDAGRARTYRQSPTSRRKDVLEAIDACPVSCMHRVSYKELVELETLRDEINEEDDVFKPKTTSYLPLHVAGMDSDRNRRSSIYHSTKAKCVQDGCRKGCYDCPTYGKGQNPAFLANRKRSDHVRAEHFIHSGELDSSCSSKKLQRRKVDL
jgi:ferredoxin